MNSNPGDNDFIQVAVRVRPLIKREIKAEDTPVWAWNSNEVYSLDDAGKDRFTFDYVLGTESTNYELYKLVKPIVEQATQGINGTVFAYGQTSSGKTHSIMGNEAEQGIIPLAINDIFSHIETHNTNRKFLIRACYLEIYNEKIRDLLDIGGKDLKIREDYQGMVSVKATEEITRTRDELMRVVHEGNKNRCIGETEMNDRSSRSHVILQIIIESSEEEDDAKQDTPVQVSSLYLVDLAGSERVAQTKATGTRLKEGGHINKSLSVLSLVMKQLSAKQEHISFRDSKLTRILSNALGGNAKTLIIATVTPVAYENTVSTLQFAKCAKTIMNQPRVNEILTESAMIKRYQQKEKVLMKELEDQKEKNINLQIDRTVKDKKIKHLEEMLSCIRRDFVTIKTPTVSKIPKRRHTLATELQKKSLSTPTSIRKPLIYPKKISVKSEEVCTPPLVDNFKTPVTKKVVSFAPTETPVAVWKEKYHNLDDSHERLKGFQSDELEAAIKNEKELEAKLAEMQGKLEAAETERQKAEAMMKDYQKKFEQRDITCSEAELQLSFLANKHSTRERDLLAKIEEHAKQLEQYKDVENEMYAIRREREYMDEMKKCADSFKQQLGELEKESVVLKTQRDLYLKECDDLRKSESEKKRIFRKHVELLLTNNELDNVRIALPADCAIKGSVHESITVSPSSRKHVEIDFDLQVDSTDCEEDLKLFRAIVAECHRLKSKLAEMDAIQGIEAEFTHGKLLLEEQKNLLKEQEKSIEEQKRMLEENITEIERLKQDLNDQRKHNEEVQRKLNEDNHTILKQLDEYKKLVEDRDAQIANHGKQLDEQNKRLEDKDAQIRIHEDLRAELEKQKILIEEQIKANEDLSKAFNEQKALIEDKDVQIMRYESLREELEQQNKVLEDKSAQISASYECLREELEEQKKALEDKTAQIRSSESLSEELEQQKKLVEDKTAQIRSYESLREELEQQKRLVEDKTVQIRSYESLQDELDIQKKLAEDKNEDLGKQLDEQRILIEAKDAQIQRYEQALNDQKRLFEDNNVSVDEKKDATEELVSLREELEEKKQLAEEKNALIKTFEDLRKQLDEQKKLVEEQNSMIETLQAFKQELDEHKKLVEDQCAMIETLQGFKQELDEHKKLVEDQCSTIETLQGFKKELDEQKKLVEEQNSMIETLQAFKQELDELKRVIEDKDATLETFDVISRELEQQKELVEEKNSAIEEFKTELGELKRVKMELDDERRLADITKQSQGRLIEQDDLIKQKEAELSKLLGELASLNVKYEDLEKSLAGKFVEINSLSDANVELETSLAHLRLQLDQQTTVQISSAANELDSPTLESQMKVNLDAKITQLTELTNRLCEKDCEIKTLTAGVDALKSTLAVKENELLGWKSRFDEVKRKESIALDELNVSSALDESDTAVTALNSKLRLMEGELARLKNQLLEQNTAESHKPGKPVELEVLRNALESKEAQLVELREKLERFVFESENSTKEEELRVKVAEQAATIESNNGELDVLLNSCNTHALRADESEAMMYSLRSTLSNREGEIVELKRRLNLSEQKLKKAQEEVDVSTDELMDKIGLIEQLEKKIAQFEAANRQQNEAIEQYVNTVKQHEKTIEELKDGESQIVDADSKISSLQSMLSIKEVEIAELKDRLSVNELAVIDARKEFNASIEEYKKQIAQYVETTKQNQIVIAQLESSVNQHEVSVQQYVETIAHHLKLIEQHENTITQYETTITQHENTIVQHENTIAQHETTITRHENTIVQHENTIGQHENTIAQHETTITRHENTIVQHENTIGQHETTITQHENAIVQHENTIAQHQNTVVQLGNNITQHENTIAQHEDTIVQHENLIAQHENTIVQRERTIEDLKQDDAVGSMETRLAETQVELKQLKDDYNRSLNDVKRAQDAFDRAQEELKQAAVELDQTKCGLAEAHADNSKLQKELEQSEDASAKLRDDLTRSNVELMERFEQTKEDLSVAENGLKLAKEELKQAAIELQETNEALANAQGSLKQANSDYDELRKKFEQSKEDLTSMEGALKLANEELNEAKSELGLARQEVSQLKESEYVIREELYRANDEIDSLRMLQHDLHQVRDDLSVAYEYLERVTDGSGDMKQGRNNDSFQVEELRVAKEKLEASQHSVLALKKQLEDSINEERDNSAFNVLSLRRQLEEAMSEENVEENDVSLREELEGIMRSERAAGMQTKQDDSVLRKTVRFNLAEQSIPDTFEEESENILEIQETNRLTIQEPREHAKPESDELKPDSDELNPESDEFDGKNIDFHKIVQDKEKSIADLQKRVEEYEDNSRELKRVIEETEDKVAGLQKALEEKEKALREKEELQSQKQKKETTMFEMKMVVREKDNILRRTEKSLLDLQIEKTALAAQLKQETSKAAELEKQLGEDFRKELKEKTDALVAVEKALEAKTKEFVESQKVLNEKTRELFSVQRDLEGMTKKLDCNVNATKKELADMQEEHKRTREELDSVRISYEEKSTELQTLQMKSEQSQRNVEEKSKMLEESERILCEKTRELEAMQKSLDENSLSLESTRCNLLEKTKALDLMQITLDEKTNELNTVKRGVEEHSNALDSCKTLLQEKEEVIVKLREQLNKQVDPRVLFDLQQEKTKELGALQKSLQETKQQLDSTRTNLEMKCRELQQAQQDLQEKSKTVDEINGTLNETRKSFHETLNQARQQYQEVASALDAVRSTLDATTHELNATKSKLDSTTQELNATRGNLEMTTQTLVATRGNLVETVQALDAARGKLAEQLKALDGLHSCNKEKEQIILQLKEQLSNKGVDPRMLYEVQKSLHLQQNAEREQFNTILAQRDDHIRKLNNHVKDFENKMKNKDECIHRLNDEMNHLKTAAASFEALRNEIEKRDTHISTLREELEKAGQQNELQKKLSEFRDRLAEMQTVVSNYEKLLNSIISGKYKITELKLEADSKMNFEQLKNALVQLLNSDSAKRDVPESPISSVDLENLNKEKDRLNSAVQEYQNRILALNQANSNLKMELAEKNESLKKDIENKDCVSCIRLKMQVNTLIQRVRQKDSKSSSSEKHSSLHISPTDCHNCKQLQEKVAELENNCGKLKQDLGKAEKAKRSDESTRCQEMINHEVGQAIARVHDALSLVRMTELSGCSVCNSFHGFLGQFYNSFDSMKIKPDNLSNLNVTYVKERQRLVDLLEVLIQDGSINGNQVILEQVHEELRTRRADLKNYNTKDNLRKLFLKDVLEVITKYENSILKYYDRFKMTNEKSDCKSCMKSKKFCELILKLRERISTTNDMIEQSSCPMLNCIEYFKMLFEMQDPHVLQLQQDLTMLPTNKEQKSTSDDTVELENLRVKYKNLKTLAMMREEKLKTVARLIEKEGYKIDLAHKPSDITICRKHLSTRVEKKENCLEEPFDMDKAVCLSGNILEKLGTKQANKNQTPGVFQTFKSNLPESGGSKTPLQNVNMNAGHYTRSNRPVYQLSDTNDRLTLGTESQASHNHHTETNSGSSRNNPGIFEIMKSKEAGSNHDMYTKSTGVQLTMSKESQASNNQHTESHWGKNGPSIFDVMKNNDKHQASAPIASSNRPSILEVMKNKDKYPEYFDAPKNNDKPKHQAAVSASAPIAHSNRPSIFEVMGNKDKYPEYFDGPKDKPKRQVADTAPASGDSSSRPSIFEFMKNRDKSRDVSDNGPHTGFSRSSTKSIFEIMKSRDQSK